MTDYTALDPNIRRYYSLFEYGFLVVGCVSFLLKNYEGVVFSIYGAVIMYIELIMLILKKNKNIKY